MTIFIESIPIFIILIDLYSPFYMHCSSPVEIGRNAACEEGRPVVLTGLGGYLAKVVAEKTGLGSAKCPWMIEAKHGQTVSITMLDFR